MGLARVGAVLGPLIGGWIIDAAVGTEWNFYAFAFPALVAAGIVALIPAATSDVRTSAASGLRGGSLPEPIN
jgi:AAHS family benzoate transporter-like MFS transporter